MPVRRTTRFCWGGGEGEDTTPASAPHFPAVFLAVQRRPLQLRTTIGESAGKALLAARWGLSLLPEG